MLHMVNKSPFQANALESCLKVAKKGSAILFLENGVIGVLSSTSFADKAKELAADYKVYAVGPDLQARGFDETAVVDGVTLVDYAGFVDIVAQNGPVQSWF